MSSKASLFLTNDNEHCYEECNEPFEENEKFIGYAIYLEMDKRNINVIVNDDADLIIKVLPGSELYNHIKKMKE